MCPVGEPTATMTTRFVLALVGFGIAVVMFLCSRAGYERAALWLMLAGVLVFAVWAVLNDAAVHEWGHDMRLY
jgi:hypothetical protein